MDLSVCLPAVFLSVGVSVDRTVCLSNCLSVGRSSYSLCVSLSIILPICPSVSVCLFYSLPVFSVFLFFCLFVCLFVSITVHHSANLSIILPAFLLACLPVCLSVLLLSSSAGLSICLSLGQSLCLPAYSSSCLPVCLSVCLSVYG